MKGKDLKERAWQVAARQCQIMLEAKPEPAKLMQVINPDPWVTVMHVSSIKCGRAALFTPPPSL